jgi:tRNA (guanine26-N2/guanine27-N2)-dimethyltransferase
VKTNAPAEIIWDIFREWIKKNPIKNTENLAASKILQAPSSHSVNFTRNPLAKAASKSSGLTRFQENPTRNWGPLARAK